MIKKIYLNRTNSRRKFLPSNNLSKFSLNLIMISYMFNSIFKFEFIYLYDNKYGYL